MAAILDPKTRFFDTLLTKEGRRQLASGELRMRYVSFSDRATTYDDSGDGVIYNKDGSVFFEAMSNPQDQIIHEAPSIVNMMSIRDPDSQPVFLNDNNGNRIQAAMFGDEVISPPDGRFVSSSITSGVDRINTIFDLNKNFYVSGSATREIEYNSSSTLRGWWVFEDTMSQLTTAGLSFTSENIVSITTEINEDNLSQIEVDGNTYLAFNGSSDFNYIRLKGLGVNRGVKIGDRIDYGNFSGYIINRVADQNSIDSFRIKIRLAAKQFNAEASGPNQIVKKGIVGTLGSFLITDDKVSENLKRNSSLSTNASYVKSATSGPKFLNDSSPTFSDVHLTHVSRKVNKSYQSRQDRAIRISLEGQFYGVNNFPKKDNVSGEKFENYPPDSANRINLVTGGAGGYEPLGNQLSFSFYLNNPADGKTETIACIYGHSTYGTYSHALRNLLRQQKAKLYVINDDLFLRMVNSSGVGHFTIQILNSIKPKNWHRVSLAWNKHYISLVLDGNMKTSKTVVNHERILEYGGGDIFTANEMRANTGYIFEDPVSGLRNAQPTHHYIMPNQPIDLILGNEPTFDHVNELSPTQFSFVDDTYLDGYIQSCEYYIDDIDNTDYSLGITTQTNSDNDVPNGKAKIGNMNVPIFNNSVNFSKYFEFKYDLNKAYIVSKLEDANAAKARVTFAHAYDPRYDNVNNPLSITLRDSVDNTVVFKSTKTTTIPNARSEKVNNNEYKFKIPDYSIEGAKINFSSKQVLAENFADAVNRANANQNLFITATHETSDINDLPTDSTVSLTQGNQGASGNTLIEFSSYNPDSIFKKDFSGGEVSGYLARGSSWTNRQRLSNTADHFGVRDASLDSVYLNYYDIPIEADVSNRSWIHSHFIASEATLYVAAVSGSIYQKEHQVNRENIVLDFESLVKSVSSILSGSVSSYKDLKLLSHLDLDLTEDNQGLEVIRYKQEREGNFLELGENLTEHETRSFKTRYENFQFVEHAYGQHNDYSVQVPNINSLDPASPISGLFFQKEATLLNIEEVIDNDLDEDENTRSSTRLPNFFILPPIRVENFVFSDPDFTIDTTKGRARPWRQFLNIITRSIKEEHRSYESAIAFYSHQISNFYKSLIPRQTLQAIFDNSNLVGHNADSNEDIVKYLSRDANAGPLNKINSSLHDFNEVIEFTKTSFNQNTFVQMFELSKDNGKPTFKKLAIRDLGVFYKFEWSTATEIQFNGTPRNDLDQRPMDDVTILGPSPLQHQKLVHAFTFGKIIRDKQGNQPGTGVYYLPIFYFEAEIGS